MKKLLKFSPWIRYTLLTVAALAALAGLVFVGISYAEKHMNASAQHAIVSLGTAATRQSVSLSKININILSGKIHLSSLIVPNEAKRKGADAFAVGTAEITVYPLSLIWGPLHIKSIVIDSPSIIGDITSAKKSSFTLAVIAAATAAYAAKSASGGKLIVDKLSITKAKLTVYSFVSGSKAHKMSFADMTMNNLGTSFKPITQADFVNKVMKSISNEAMKAASRWF